MHLSLNEADLARYVARQASHFFPDRDVDIEEIRPAIGETMARVENCFAAINNKYFFDGTQALFNHLHTDQYATFLYYLSNTLWKQGAEPQTTSKIYYLNKALHALDVFYQVDLPPVFFLNHSVGTVLGPARYGSYFVVLQGCTVGGNAQAERPYLGEGVAMLAHSTIAGRCRIEDNCLVAAGAFALDFEAPTGMIIHGQHPNVACRPTSRSVKERYFRS